MGRYFGVVNKTRGQAVASYWKDYPPSSDEMVQIAKNMKWNLQEDIIYSSSYCDLYTWDGEKQDWHEPLDDDVSREPLDDDVSREPLDDDVSREPPREPLDDDVSRELLNDDVSRYDIFDVDGNLLDSDPIYFCN